MGRTDWLPSALVEQAGVFGNIDAKIDGYAGVLGLSSGVVADIHRVCGQFAAAQAYINGCSATMQSAYSWRDHILKGSPRGSLAPAPPRFPVLAPSAGDKVGIIEEMRALREQITSSPAYTTAIGADLMILGGSRTRIELHDREPELKVATMSDYTLSISGKMHGLHAVSVEYQPNGSEEWKQAGFLTSLPATFKINPATPGMPEAGHVRFRYFHKNTPVGKYSSGYAVTLWT
jgi:hypothetical protein